MAHDLASAMTPGQIVTELDRYIVGQAQAKRAVAIALRNRYRRRGLPPELQDEVLPKNILMVGPTGVGKTEIARRLARLVKAPFVKVEATKYTEVGYVGRDVESMVRDLVETAIRMVRQEKTAGVQEQATRLAERRLLELLVPDPRADRPTRNPLEMLFGRSQQQSQPGEAEQEEQVHMHERRELIRQKLTNLELEEEMVKLEVEDRSPPMLEVFSNSGMEEMGINLQDALGGLLPKRKKERRVKVKEARRLLSQEETQKLIDMDEVIAEAIQRAEQTGIIFLDELDKIAGRETNRGPEVSREGVQRDILPIVEGSTVLTKYGPVKTDHVLFIAAGAFHVAKPSDLIPELQGRFPIRVELESLTREDFQRILTEPKNSLIRQYTELLRVDGVVIEFTPDAIIELAGIAYRVNSDMENIGARRLHTILERVLEDLAFGAPEEIQGPVKIDREYVNSRMEGIIKDQDLSRYIL